MSWSDPDPALVELFEATVVAVRRVERRTLFGCPAAFVGGHLAGAVFRDQFVLKLGVADAERLHAGRTPQAFEPLPGRRMRELFVVPRGVVADRRALREWIGCALERLAAWPPKAGTNRSRGRRAAVGVAPVPRVDAFERLGPRSREWLAGAGIDSIERLRTTGSVRAYVAVRRSGARPSLNLLWALEGALSGERWQDVAREHRTSLLLALEDELASSGAGRG